MARAVLDAATHLAELSGFDGDSSAVLLGSNTRTGAPVPESLAKQRVKKGGAALLGLGGLAALGVLVAREGAGDVLAACGRAGFGVVPLVAAPAVGLFLHTLAWWILLPTLARPTLLRSYRAFIAAQAGNDLGFGVLGEPMKVLCLAPSQRDVGIAVVALDNLANTVSVALFFAALGSAVATPAFAEHRGVGLGVLVAAAAACAVVLALSATARRIAGTSLTLLTARPFHATLSVALHFFGKLWLVAEMALALFVLGTATEHGAVLLALASATATAVGTPVPGQVGIAEGALVTVAAAAGITPATALAIGLLRRLRSVVWLALGAVFAFPLMRSRLLRHNEGPHAQASTDHG